MLARRRGRAAGLRGALRSEPRARLRARLGADDPAAQIDPHWKIAAETLKFDLITRSETVLHGRRHRRGHGDDPRCRTTIAITESSHACRGPMAFDLGTILGSLFMNLFAQGGFGAGCELYRAHLIDQMERLAAGFADGFSQRWRGRGNGTAFPR